MYKKLIPALAAAGLLVFGIGVSGAIAHDDQPTPPVACTTLAPGGDENDAADAVANAADNVSQEADNQQADDQQGDEADGDNNDQGEQGDCNDENDDDQGDDDQGDD
jgi:hypothetical protein